MYEYQIRETYLGRTISVVMKEICLLALQGWEVHTLAEGLHSGGSQRATFLLKRKVGSPIGQQAAHYEEEIKGLEAAISDANLTYIAMRADSLKLKDRVAELELALADRDSLAAAERNCEVCVTCKNAGRITKRGLLFSEDRPCPDCILGEPFQ